MTAESLESQSLFGSTKQALQQVYKVLTGPRLLWKLKGTLGANHKDRDSEHDADMTSVQSDCSTMGTSNRQQAVSGQIVTMSAAPVEMRVPGS